MDFALLPPEIISAKMYTGPGSGSLMAAASSWDSLAAEMATTADAYQSVLSTLTTLQWRGPAAESMTSTVAPYVSWLYSTAEQAQQTAMQARAAAMAFEQAYAMTVPPPAIAANRAQLMVLIATNFFGQNTSAIAATEAQYAEMWAQDAGAMFGYAASSAAAATALTPFVPPQQTTNPAGVTAQSAAVTQAETTAAPLSPLEQLANYLLKIPLVYDVLSSLSYLEDQFIGEGFAPYINTVVSGFATPISAGTALITVIQSAGQAAAGQAAGAAAPAAASLGSALAGASQLGSAVPSPGLGGAVLANVARANTLGPLSVPASWTAPSTGRVSALAPAGLTTFTGTEEAAASGMPGVPGMPAGTLARGSGVLPRYGVRLTVMAHPPAAG